MVWLRMKCLTRSIGDASLVFQRTETVTYGPQMDGRRASGAHARADLLAPVFMRFLYAPPTFLSCFYDRVAKLQAESIQGCIVMDRIFLIVLIGFAVLSAALLGLCAAMV